MTIESPTVGQANVYFDEQGQPISEQFGDVYFSKDNGLAESRYVFLESNHLQHRFTELKPGAKFCIGETGFGSGLNFLATCQLWRQCAPQGAKLHFISCEKYPLNIQALSKTLELWPELNGLSQTLVALYPSIAVGGFHRLTIADDIALTLIFDDVEAAFKQLLAIDNCGENLDPKDCTWSPNYISEALIDAWFLDGFAPAKNPEMWRESLFALMARLSSSSTTLATFTAASMVRKGLIAQGFAITKKQGFGRKREMLVGLYSNKLNVHEEQQKQAHHPLENSDQLQSSAKTTGPKYSRSKPNTSWHLFPDSFTKAPEVRGSAQVLIDDFNKTLNKPNNIAVIGGGLAGCHTAAALAQRSYKVTLFEQQQIASGASGNPQGVLYSKISHGDDQPARFNLSALSFALRHYHQKGFFERCGQACGVLQIASSVRTQQQAQTIASKFAASPEFIQYLDAQQASEIAGVELQEPCLYLPNCGWLAPKQVCEALSEHPNIERKAYHQILELNCLDPGWRLVGTKSAGQRQAFAQNFDAVVVCNANEARQFNALNLLPSQSIRGQISYAASSPSSQNLKTVICGEGYIAPAQSPQHMGLSADSDRGLYHCLGASFNIKQSNKNIDPRDHEQNIEQGLGLSPDFASLKIATVEHGRVSFRCTTPDYLPIVGPAPKQEAMLERFGDYRHNSKRVINQTGCYHPNLYINLGHGSKGLNYTPICAELIANLIHGEPLALARDLMLHIHSGRFLMRDLARNRL